MFHSHIASRGKPIADYVTRSLALQSVAQGCGCGYPFHVKFVLDSAII